jgi:hypothetical protein
LDVKGCSVVELTSDDGRVDPVDDLIRRTEIVVEHAPVPFQALSSHERHQASSVGVRGNIDLTSPGRRGPPRWGREDRPLPAFVATAVANRCDD